MPGSLNSSVNNQIVAVLTSSCNKYTPGKQTFYLQSLNPFNAKANGVFTDTINTSNIKNADKINVTTSISCGSNIVLELPREVARSFPKKWIPAGTRFILSFIGGDVTKPIIVGREYDNDSI